MRVYHWGRTESTESQGCPPCSRQHFPSRISSRVYYSVLRMAKHQCNNVLIRPLKCCLLQEGQPCGYIVSSFPMWQGQECDRPTVSAGITSARDWTLKRSTLLLEFLTYLPFETWIFVKHRLTFPKGGDRTTSTQIMKTPERWGALPRRALFASIFAQKSSKDVKKSRRYVTWRHDVVPSCRDLKRFDRESADRRTDKQTGPILYPRPLTREGKMQLDPKNAKLWSTWHSRMLGDFIGTVMKLWNDNQLHKVQSPSGDLWKPKLAIPTHNKPVSVEILF